MYRKHRTTKDFISEATTAHHGFYIYTKTIFTGVTNKICVICPRHGEFLQEAKHHLNGGGCCKCSLERGASKLRRSLEQFVAIGHKLHNNKFDYAKVDYKNNQTKVTIICPAHGEFLQLPQSHLKGIGCRRCTNEARVGKKAPWREGSNCNLWKGGVSKLSQIIRKRSEYHQWRYKIYKRDSNACVICGSKKRLEADHIIPMYAILQNHNILDISTALACSMLWDTANGRTLCHECHTKTDTYGMRQKWKDKACYYICYNKETQEQLRFETLKSLGTYLNIHKRTVGRYLHSNTYYKDKYEFKRILKYDIN